MFKRIIYNDIKNSKAVTFMTIIFVTAAAMLVSLAAILIVNLSGALDNLMEKAESPHFMQMHAGEIDLDRLYSFADEHHNVEAFQVAEFLGIDNSQIFLGEHSLEHNVQDNGLSVQNKHFDYLLNLTGERIQVSDSEIYVPVYYMKEDLVDVGDNVVISDKAFTVAGFLRDSTMNPALASSKRFLVSENDFAEMKKQGTMEYLIEFRLKDYGKIGEFETSYAAAGLEANGPAITYSLLKMLNAISDGILIAVILFVSVLIVVISFICIRFTLLAKLEDDYREISVMKAIGLQLTDIKRIYLAKYIIIALVGSLLGLILSLLFQNVLLENIRLFMGESDSTSLAILAGIVGIIIVIFTIILYVNFMLRHFRTISVAEALRFGSSQDKKTSSIRFRLSDNKIYSTNLFLGIKDVLNRKKLYLTNITILIVATFILIVPQNLYQTISSPSFIQYMGIGDYDLRIQTNNEDDTNEIVSWLEKDTDISSYTVLTTRVFKVLTENGEENLNVELGDHSVFPIEFTEGKAPSTSDEVSLSVIHADEMNKQVGDTLTIIIDGMEKELTVSGIYSDITNGGKTAKAAFHNHSADIMWTVIPVNLHDTARTLEKVQDYSKTFPFAKVVEIDEFYSQTFGTTIDSVKTASFAAIAIALVVTILITLLFMKMLVAKDRPSISVLKAFGFTNTDIIRQFVTRSMVVLLIGIIIGTILANTVGELLAGALISSFGAASFTFVIEPLAAYLFSPLLMVSAVLIGTIIGTARVGEIKLADHIKE